ncbi:MAG: tryptophan 2,3-dioxygenase family protein, partial [Acidimicrobiales bacterium]
HLPQVVDPTGVDGSPYPRRLATTTDETREATAVQTGGEPLVDFAGTSNPYIDYQSIDLLLSLQHPRSDGYDEMCFFVMGQVKELLFRGIHFELVNAQLQIRSGEVANALEILKRARAFMEYIADSWDVLSTISTEGFNQFRDGLGTASGQLSFMYRHVEFALGNKSRKLAEAHRNVPHVWPAMKQALESPSLYDDVVALLSREGHQIDDAGLSRDWSEAYQPNESVEAAWFAIYQNPDTANPLYQLGEALISLDEHFSIYRWRHFVTVNKIIGYKPGTGGSAGVGWLEAVTRHRFFPELWAIRTQM